MFKPFSLNIHGRLVEYERPAIMGIINVTPDSFYAGSRTSSGEIGRRVLEMIADGADIIDLGAYSSRPGAPAVSEAEEVDRLSAGLAALRAAAPDVVVSVDTFRASVARTAVDELGADIINDISGGTLDGDMFDTVASLHVPYILMHMRGTPADMHTHCRYADVVADVITELAARLDTLTLMGVADVIVDPGFGFAKTLEQNYKLLDALATVGNALGRPVLAGMSRKSMATRLLGISAAEALPATVALNTIALMRGASILRVHDVAPAVQAVEIHQALKNA